MRKTSKIMAVVLALLVLVSVASVSVSAKMWPNDKYATPSRNVPYFSKAPVNDGVIKSGEWGNCTIEISQKAMQGTEGHLWSDNQAADPNGDLPMPGIPMTDASGTAYLGWNETYFFLALEVKTAEHYNNQLKPEELWMGDCLQIQIAEKEGGVRYEFGYARNTKNNLSYSYQWTPAAISLPNGSKNSTAGTDNKQKFYVERNNSTKTTVYEIAIPTAQFSVKKDLKLSAGSKIPFALALHVYEKDRPSSGCFYEWALGVVGGTEEKDITKGAVLTCVKGKDEGKDDPTTTKKPDPTTTKKDDDKPTTTVAKPGATTTAAKPGATTTAADVTTTTTAPTTAPADLEAKAIDPSTDYTLIEDADTLAKFDALKSDDQDIVVNQAAAEAKFALYPPEDLIGVYAIGEDGELAPLSPSDTDGDYQIFDTTEMGEVTVYVVTKAAVVEPTPEETTAAPEATTTAAPKTTSADATTTAADKADSEGGFPWWIIIVIVAVVVIAGVIFFILKKKKDDEE